MVTLFFFVFFFYFRLQFATVNGESVDLLAIIRSNGVSQLDNVLKRTPELLSTKHKNIFPSQRIVKEQSKKEEIEYTLLDIATIYGSVEIVEYLLKHKSGGIGVESMYHICESDVNLMNMEPSGRSHSKLNAVFEDKDFSKVLLETYLNHKVDINDVSSDAEGKSLLITCVLGGYLDITEALLKNGANVYHKDKNGFDVFDWFVKAPVTRLSVCVNK
ncbi:hypothetical protein RFI_13047 [Reticulomyxa filosa]|uniref:Uncharacterized protein n=1 Tax=Reticulomyxa filosa TaxID=46433 RepID=X6NDN3_RETFI|nr:hypothetical protein RFI_13047 [Reticulomyxa filosa]|eukprot:ETO24111.1 hypothetical protein RFI_13047 [Reticulomyxa filosa]